MLFQFFFTVLDSPVVRPVKNVAPGGFEPPTMHAPPFELRSRPERVVS